MNGLERMAAVLQNVNNNYETDILKSIVQEAAKLSGENDLTNLTKSNIRSFKSSSFLIADGVVPSNEGRGYVLQNYKTRPRHAHKLE